MAIATFKFVIDGVATDSVSKDVTEVRNPSNGEVVGTVSKGTREDAKRAVDSAELGFKAWSKVAPAARGEVLYKAATLIEQNIKELSETLTREQGKPIKE